ncbi:carbohydrate sulfotransferase 1-like [Amphiura filiformis]|uniref:carbohydrate sulfotransferase 1-like n=1 Tax=Amphiura filiformis TaxID=82378 RepID=UPI003B20E690
MARSDWSLSKKFLLVILALSSWSFILIYYFAEDFQMSTVFTHRQNHDGATNEYVTPLYDSVASETYAQGLPASYQTQMKIERLQKIFDGNPNNTNPRLLDKVQVIIVSQKRSGSSFVGELFNQSLDFTYFFEPLSSLTTRMVKRWTTGKFDDHAKQILNGTLHGNFTNMPIGWWSEDIPRHTCWGMTLSQIPSLCGANVLDSQNSILVDLKDNMAVLGASTRSRKGVAIKAIRIQNIKLLEDFVTDPSLNVKIIHLVRDPRGVMQSRTKLAEVNADLRRRKGPRADEITDLCQHMERNLQYLNKDWLKGRYKIIRYEDIAEQPLKVASEIYKFVGLKLPMRVKTWLHAHCHTERTSDGHAFSHSRNSKETAHAWRKNIGYYKMIHIQTRCRKAMDMLGYAPILSYFDLGNFKIKTTKNLSQFLSNNTPG